MTEIPGEVAGLPMSGPATLPTAKAWCNIGADDDRSNVQLQQIVDAVNRKVRIFPIAARSVILDGDAEDDENDNTWTGDIILGADLLVARLWSRKDSPNGVAAFSDLGAVYVQRNDPDIGLMLEIGSNARPLVG